MGGFGAYYFLVPTAQLEDPVRMPTARLEHLLRVRTLLATIWTVGFVVPAVLLAAGELTATAALLLCAVVTYSIISLVLAAASIVRIRSELAGRRWEARFPVQEE